MTALKDTILAAIRWVWSFVVSSAKWVGAKLDAGLGVIYDPPPKTVRFWLASFAALAAVCWVTFAFVNSWYYQPAMAFLTGDDGDVVLPEMAIPLPPVPTPVTVLPSVAEPAVVCHDMSDTPHCEKVAELEPVIVSVPPPVAKPKGVTGYKAKKSPASYKRRKREPYKTHWGF